MLLLVVRDYGQNSTQGELYVNGIYECFSLELKEKFEGQSNVHQKTCIPEGKYLIELYDSPHNKRLVPRLKNVPGRDEIEIHIANETNQLLGCIAVGHQRQDDTIWKSKEAFDALMAKIEPAIQAGQEVWIQMTSDE